MPDISLAFPPPSSGRPAHPMRTSGQTPTEVEHGNGMPVILIPCLKVLKDIYISDFQDSADNSHQGAAGDESGSYQGTLAKTFLVN